MRVDRAVTAVGAIVVALVCVDVKAANSQSPSHDNLIEITAVVTDEHGQFVNGLTSDDFVVEDSGRRVPIVTCAIGDADRATTSADGRFLVLLLDDSDAPDAQDLEVASYSRVEALRRRDFDGMTEEEMAEVRRLIRMMRVPAGVARSRRQRRGGDDRIDMRRLLRASLRYGGEPLVFPWRGPTVRPRHARFSKCIRRSTCW